jgi:hypothetical protein
MDKELERSAARNESTFREVNEALRAGHWPGEEDAAIAIRCECGELGCNRLIEVGTRDYERVRAHPRRFLLAIDHEIPEAETIVERHRGYLVVEKGGEAGRVAEATDPRG